MEQLMSPRYKMSLIKLVAQAIENAFFGSEAGQYIYKWYRCDDYNWENFSIATYGTGQVDVQATLHNVDDETLLKIAIDMGVDTPNFIPSIPTFRNDLKSSYITASATFERAFRQIEEHPDLAISMANSALESIIKEILKDSRVQIKIKGTETLYSLTIAVLKFFSLFPDDKIPSEIKSIGSSMLTINQSIEKLRSEKTSVHGRSDGDYIIDDPIYAYFVVNSVVTVGTFLNSYYKKKFPKEAVANDNAADELPF